MNLENITREVVAICQQAGAFIRSQANRLSATDIEEKGVHNLVTYVDKESENMIVKSLTGLVKGAGFIAEEKSDLPRGDVFNWIIDPLDGTTNFIHGIPVYSISVALIKGNELLVGVVYEINLDECFYAWKSGGAWLNGQPVHVSPAADLNQSLIATGFPYYDYRMLPAYLELLGDLMQSTRGVRRLGSAAVDLAYVACGRFELFYEYGLHPWDVAAGVLIVEEAGGKVTDFKLGNDFIFGFQIIASNTHTHNTFHEKLKKYFIGNPD